MEGTVSGVGEEGWWAGGRCGAGGRCWQVVGW